ncbi:uncharacterized protein BO97DRAFT_445045 [Aspergillus homomorphus CBS 101889]|uniref:Tat pathway signal sequence n=1 Tax=Aspergillus homomorphus (strain CBS 101889) TaxID=1450537 RepID=A0A395HUR0_ASPHC|nr:hypothetical protein BO97DRAFT_445045 [Aspergillus homomorphus CBS 101889]RAL09954.1 hypothetical protein BO97DRAFT_445045 [Aspergillus homomorphus CBS 101889]
MDQATTSSQLGDVTLTNDLAKIHYIAEQSIRNAHSRAEHKTAPPCPDFATKWKVEKAQVRALYTERASDLASSDQYKGAQVDDTEFAKALYAKHYAELDTKRVPSIFALQLIAFRAAVQMLLSSGKMSGSQSAQVKNEGTAELSEKKKCNVDNVTDQDVQTLEAAVGKGVKALENINKLFGEFDDWNDELEWLTRVSETQMKARKEKVIIGVVGGTGAGKSSLINALIDEKDILTTDCMRASTAVPVEVSYNSGSPQYRAEVQFIEQKDWIRELEILFAELRDHSEELARGEVLKDAEAAVALDKIMAVYPAFERQKLSESTPTELLEDTRITKMLGQTIDIEENNSKKFAQSLKSYIDSKGKKRERPKSTTMKTASGLHPDSVEDMELADRGIGLWPLVRVVRVFVPAKALSTGAVLVDLPGIYDSNAARVAVANDYMKCCSAHWIVAPINRAVNDKVARDLLGKNFRAQMHMDNAFSDITFVCSKTDDIAPTEVAQSLGLELPDIDGVGAFPERLETLKIQLQAHKDCLSQIADKIDATEEEIEELEERLAEDFDLDAASLLSPQKRKRASTAGDSREELLASTAVSENIGDEDEDKDEASELVRQLHELGARRKALNKQRRKIQRELEVCQRTEFDDLRSCIMARNDFSKHEIRHDFARTVAGLDLEDEQLDGNPSQAPLRDYGELERDLSVFCVSTKAYQGLRSNSARNCRVLGFSQLEQTEIPALQQYCIALTRKSREKTARRFLVALNVLLQSMSLWSSPATETSAKRRGEIEAGFRGALHDLTEALEKSRDACISASRSIIQQQITGHLDRAWRHGHKEYSSTVAGWNASSREGGFHWVTYHALCRRQGVHKTFNLNDQIAYPMISRTKPGWRKAFEGLLPDAYQQLGEDLKLAFSRFHSEALRWAQWELSRATSERLQRRLVALHESINQEVETLEDWTDQEKRKAKSRFSDNVTTGFQETYEAGGQHKGTGTLRAIRRTMSQPAGEKGIPVFRDVTDKVGQAFEEWLRELDKKLERLVEGRLQEATQDYHCALLAPHLRSCSEEEMRLKARTYDLIRGVEVELQLGRLLELDHPSELETAPQMDQPGAAATEDY